VVALLVAGGAALYNRFFAEPPTTEPLPVVTHHTVLTQVTRMGKLELVKYNFRDIVEYEKGRTTGYELLNQYLNKARVVLIVNGEAVGCIDLTKVEAADVVEGDSTVIVYLPEPELCVYKINHDQSKLYDTQNTYFQEEGKLVNEATRWPKRRCGSRPSTWASWSRPRRTPGRFSSPFSSRFRAKKLFSASAARATFANWTGKDWASTSCSCPSIA
jgi:hypothetical protein